MLLLLRDGRVVSARALADRFEVSKRTIYRDLELLSSQGVPLDTEPGRSGGVRLGEGYFLPPVTLGPEEAVSLLLGAIMTRKLGVAPFTRELDDAERKLLAVLPERTRSEMERAARLIGFEAVPDDLLHPERDEAAAGRDPAAARAERDAAAAFLRAILSRSRLTITYNSPYRGPEPKTEVEPEGLVWDRDRWYLAGKADGKRRMWRADRVASFGPGRSMPPVPLGADVSELLGRRWLKEAMEGWREFSPVRIRMSVAQAARLSRDWYFGNAEFRKAPGGKTDMLYGERDADNAAALVRWLGPGAELVEPKEWRAGIREGLVMMAEAHSARERREVDAESRPEIDRRKPKV